MKKEGKQANKFESENYASLKSVVAIAEANKNGGQVVFPGPYQLQVDLDTQDAINTFRENLTILEWLIGVKDSDVTPSRTVGKFHGWVTLFKPVQSNMERVLLQACLGSDPKRELLSYARILQRDEHPTLFIEGGTKAVVGEQGGEIRIVEIAIKEDHS